MAKEYFSHDYNARNDRKIAALVKDYKSSGYGIFWSACEMMHEDGGCIEFDDLTIGAIAKDLNEDPVLIKEVLEKCFSKYQLFKQTEAVLEANEAKLKLTSNRVKQNLDDRKGKKKVKSDAGRIGGIESGKSRRSKRKEALLRQREANEPKERKGKESIKSSNSTKVGGIFPTQNFEIILPDFEIGKAIEFLTTTKNVQADRKMVLSIWETFKIKKFTGQKFYKNEREIISHFFDSLKYEQVNGTQTYQRSSSAKSARITKSTGAEYVVESLKNDLLADSGGAAGS